MTWHKHTITIVFLICCIACSTESRYRDRDRKRLDKNSRQQYSGAGAGAASVMSSTSVTIDLCSREREMKLLCYCSPDDFANIPVTKADCWIFQKDFHQNDSTWQSFHRKRTLKHLKFTVQQTGYMDYIPTKYLEILTNLTTISIEYSQILIVKSHAFGNLPNLELITLTNNLIEAIDKDAFANHIMLKELNLMRNQITEIDRFAFRNLPALEKLYLSWNNITNLHEDVFSELGRLEELKLDQNLISVLTRETFKGLGNLKTLKLSHNNLNFIGDTVFAELWSLQELELDDNRIERISERALDGLNNLKTLNLRNNRLRKLDNGVLRGVPALLSINLQENLLETLTYYNMQPFMDNLFNNSSELSVSDNKFICDCRLSWIFDLRNRTKNINLKNSLEEIECMFYGKNHIMPPQLLPAPPAHASSPQRPRSHSSGAAASSASSSSEILMNVISQQTNEANIPSTNRNRGRDIIFNDNTRNRAIRPEFDPEYYDDEVPSPYENFAEPDGHIVELLKIPAETLPCPEELSDPTELPLSRESIGMDIRGTHQSSKSTTLNYHSYHGLGSCSMSFTIGVLYVGGWFVKKFLRFLS